MKKTIDATFFIDQEEVRIEGNIPFLFKPFQGKIEKVLAEEIDRWLAKAKAGEI